MLRHRVIPFLLIKDGGLVKTREFRDPRYIGDPLNSIKIFNDKEVSELALLDISRSAQGLGPDFEMVRDIAGECFIPLSYGGGVGSIDDAARLFSLGVEKVIVKTAAIRSPKLVNEISTLAGSQSVAVCVDVDRGRFGKMRIYAPGTDLHRDAEWTDYVRELCDRGAGEVIIQSVNRDSSMSGLDLDAISAVANAVEVPIVAVGGVGSMEDMRRGISAGASAIGAGSYFVFHGPRRAVLITYPEYSELLSIIG